MTPSAIHVLGILPLGVFGLAALVTPPRAPAPIAPIAVPTESITERRQDDQTFRRRWPIDLPPAVILREVPVIVSNVTPSAIPAPRVEKRVALPTDVCARHGMRRVDYLKRGYRSWRCSRGNR